jgi:hypothetical protein
VRVVRDRLNGAVGAPPRNRFEPAVPGPWLSVDFEGWYQVRLATGGDPFNDPRGVSGWQFAYPGEPDLDRIVRFRPGPFLRDHVHPDVGVGVTVTSATVDGADVPALAGAVVDLLDAPVFDGHNGVLAGDGDEPIVPLRLRVGAGAAVLERSALDDYPRPCLDLVSLGLPKEPAAAEALRARHGLAAADVPDRVEAARKQVRDALTATPQTEVATRLVLDDRLRRIGSGTFRFSVAWRLRLIGSDAAATLPDGVGSPATGEPWWLELLSTGFDADAGCALVRGVLHAPLVRGDGAASAGPPPWRIPLSPAGPEAVPAMPLDAMGVRPGRLDP